MPGRRWYFLIENRHGYSFIATRLLFASFLPQCKGDEVWSVRADSDLFTGNFEAVTAAISLNFQRIFTGRDVWQFKSAFPIGVGCVLVATQHFERHFHRLSHRRSI